MATYYSAYEEAYNAKINMKRKKSQEKRRIEKMKSNLFTGFIITSVALLVIVTFMTVLMGNTKLNELQYQISSKENEIEKLVNDVHDLELMKEQATSIDNVKNIAVEKLSMQYPHESQTVVIKASANYALNNSLTSDTINNNNTTGRVSLIDRLRSIGD